MKAILLIYIILFTFWNRANGDEDYIKEIDYEANPSGRLFWNIWNTAKTPDGCHYSPSTPNGYFQGSATGVGESRRLRCKKGYLATLPSNQVPQANCSSQGEWIINAKCRRGCRQVPEIENGHIDDGDSYLGAERAITCDKGHKLWGTTTVTCRENGTWSTAGDCVRITETPGAIPDWYAILIIAAVAFFSFLIIIFVIVLAVN